MREWQILGDRDWVGLANGVLSVGHKWTRERNQRRRGLFSPPSVH